MMSGTMHVAWSPKNLELLEAQAAAPAMNLLSSIGVVSRASLFKIKKKNSNNNSNSNNNNNSNSNHNNSNTN